MSFREQHYSRNMNNPYNGYEQDSRPTNPYMNRRYSNPYEEEHVYGSIPAPFNQTTAGLRSSEDTMYQSMSDRSDGVMDTLMYKQNKEILNYAKYSYYIIIAIFVCIIIIMVYLFLASIYGLMRDSN